MKTVLHIGAEAGEFEQYHFFGTRDLVYVEPDMECLEKLRKNEVKYYEANGKHMNINIIPKACSSESGQKVTFYANGSGQSSIQKPGERTTQMVGDDFSKYTVDTISLDDLINYPNFRDKLIDYLCIDVQGHESQIIMHVDPNLLNAKVSIIDVELMTDKSQYDVDSESWKNICKHLINSGFEPLLHPSGMTESFLFVNFNKLLITQESFIAIVESARDDTINDLFGSSLESDMTNKANLYASLFETGFLPITHAGGVVHCSMIDRFRKLVLSRYSAISAMQFNS